MKTQKILILAAAAIVLIFLVISAFTALPYLNIRELQLEQGIYADSIKMTATNPTSMSIIFPETELKVYIDDVYFGNLHLYKTDIPPGQKIEIPGDFKVDEAGLNHIQQKNAVFQPSVVKYEGIATIDFLGMKNKVPFELQKGLNEQQIEVG